MNSEYDFSVIKYLRKRLGLTLEKLAEKAGVTYSTTASIELNKTSPSLKTLDAIASTLRLSTGNLVSLAERRLVQRRDAKTITAEEAPKKKESVVGLDKCKVAFYDKAKIIRCNAKKGEPIHVMSLHEDCNEFCYILKGRVELQVTDKKFELSEDQTALFDGILNHSYTALENCEFITVHIPKGITSIDSLMDKKDIANLISAAKKNKK